MLDVCKKKSAFRKEIIFLSRVQGFLMMVPLTFVSDPILRNKINAILKRLGTKSKSVKFFFCVGTLCFTHFRGRGEGGSECNKMVQCVLGIWTSLTWLEFVMLVWL